MHVDNAKDLDVVMPMYNVIEYNNYSKTSGSLLRYCRDEPNATITDSDSFTLEARITGRTPNDTNKKDGEITVPLK